MMDSRTKRAAWRVLCVLLLANSIALGSGAEALTVQLEQRQVAYCPLVFEPKVEKVAAFVNEPVSTGLIRRGKWIFGDPTNSFGALWAESSRTLWLDLNRNGDLTDDPEGVFKGTGKEVQLFTGFALPYTQPANYKLQVDAHLFQQNGGTRVFIYVRSLWEGSLVLDGAKYYIALIDQPDGLIGPPASQKGLGDRLVIRRWADRDQRFLWWHASLEKVHGFAHVKLVSSPYRAAGNGQLADAFSVPARLFFAGRAFQVKCALDEASQGNRLTITLEPASPGLATVQVRGSFIKRLVFEDRTDAEGFTAVLDDPGESCTVPRGNYTRQTVLLQSAETNSMAAGVATNILSLRSGEKSVFHAGAPLTNHARLRSKAAIQTGTAYFDYRAENSGGINFMLVSPDRENPPGAEILQDDRVVSTGKFEFG